MQKTNPTRVTAVRDWLIAGICTLPTEGSHGQFDFRRGHLG